MIANKYTIRRGVGYSDKYLTSFDKALIEAGVGNYNLVRLSSILPAGCEMTSVIDLKEGSLLPTAYSTISSDVKGDHLVSCIGVGIPKDESKVGIIMEYSRKNVHEAEVEDVLRKMIEEAFELRGCELSCIEFTTSSAYVLENEQMCTTFACISEW